MSKTLLYYGSQIENTPIFNSNITLYKWHYILENVKQKGVSLYNSKKVYYYNLNNIDIIETIENTRIMYNYCNFKMHRINIYLKLDYIETIIDFITPEFDYYNKQIHNLQVFTIDNIKICFDEYLEDGNNYNNIYLMVNHESDMNKFMDILNSFEDI